MRLTGMILLAYLTAIAPAYSAEDSEDRSYPSDDRPSCMDRDADSGRGGCLTREDGSARPIAPEALPPEADMTRQSPPESAATDRGELPGGPSMER